MKPVWYLEYCRMKRKVCKQVVYPIILMVLLFLICLVVEHILPRFNATYMRWPDMVKDFLCLPGWDQKLWLNVWQLFALGYPFYIYYVVMEGLACSVVAEERLETNRYLQNAGVGKYAFLFSKCLFWLFSFVISVAMLGGVDILLRMILQESTEIANAITYYGTVLVIGVLYLSIALFVAVCNQNENRCSSVIAGILVIPWLISRISALVQFFATLLVETGREGVVVERVSLAAQKLQALQILSPLTWCWPRLEVSSIEALSAVVICILLSGMSFFVWSSKKVLR